MITNNYKNVLYMHMLFTRTSQQSHGERTNNLHVALTKKKGNEINLEDFHVLSLVRRVGLWFRAYLPKFLSQTFNRTVVSEVFDFNGVHVFEHDFFRRKNRSVTRKFVISKHRRRSFQILRQHHMAEINLKK